jgi:predicted HTH transcriptional regulator
MTEPIELLQERFEEIKKAIAVAKKNNLLKMDLHALNIIHNKYYVSIEILKRSTDISFVNKGILYKDAKGILSSQEKDIQNLKRRVGKLKYDLSKIKNADTIMQI